MGKSLIIKGADFSANGIQEDVSVDITSLFAPFFQPQKGIRGFDEDVSEDSTKRCCIPAMLFSTIGVDIANYSKVEINIKTGFDYACGTGAVPGQTGWQGWNGDVGGQLFAWVTTNQRAIVTVDATTLGISLNLRYDNDAADFSNNTVLTDVVESIILYP